MTKFGIDIFDDVPWGTHSCLFYKTKEDLIDILVPYFKAGLENNEFCLWITSEPLNEIEADEAIRKALPDFVQYLKRGQIEIIPHTEWYFKGRVFRARGVFNDWIDKLNHALANGYEGLRLTGNAFWLEKKDWRNFVEYEEAVNNAIGKHRMVAVCTYSLDKCGVNEIVNVVLHHQSAVIKHEGKWEIRKSSEHGQMEETLQRSEDRYRALFEGSRDAIYITTREGEFVDVNQSATDLFGYTREEMKDLNARELYANPHDRSRFQQAIEQKGFVRDYEVKLHKKDGTKIDCLITSATQRTDNGNIIGYQGIIRDISEHKKTDEELKLKARLLDAATDSIFVHDLEGNFIYLNEAAYKSRGYSKDELMAMNLYALDTPWHARLVEQQIKKLREKGTVSFKSAHFRKDMSVMPVEVYSRIIKSGNREILISVTRDITESRQRERELEAIFDGIEDGIFLIGKDFQILRANRAILKMFDKSDFPELIGNRCFSVFYGTDSICENCPAEKALEDREVHHVPRITKILNKRKLVLAVSAFPIKDEDGMVNNVIVHLKNITDMINLEEQVLYQERLAGIGELAAGVAHEIRNPLGNIVASAQLCLSKHELSEDARKYLRIILKNSENANKVVKGLLGFAKPRELSFKTGDVRKVIKDACEWVKARCIRQHVNIVKRWSKRVLQILLDEKTIEEAFLNFILNALDAMPAGGRLTITAYPDSQNKEVMVSFSDTGCGISQESLDKIFQPFFTTKKDGAGLGLSLARQIIELHKGKIHIESKPDYGTEVMVRLPVYKEGVSEDGFR